MSKVKGTKSILCGMVKLPKDANYGVREYVEPAQRNPGYKPELWSKEDAIGAKIAKGGIRGALLLAWYRPTGDYWLPRVGFLPLFIVELIPHGEKGLWAKLWYKVHDLVWLPR